MIHIADLKPTPSHWFTDSDRLLYGLETVCQSSSSSSSSSGSEWPPPSSDDLRRPRLYSHLYTGQRYDPETRLYHCKARYYHPPLGRFVSRDSAGYEEGLNLYQYVRNNPVIYVDTTGLDTYWQNRKIGGSSRKWNYNKVSHSFVFTTNPDGTVAHTYSWGNTANTHGWNKDQPEDICAAKEALKDNATEHRGDAELDPFVEQAFNELNKEENEDPWRLWNNCKTEARALLAMANKLLEESTLKPSPPSPPKISVGEQVWAYDHDRQVWTLMRVVDTEAHDYSGMLVTVKAGEDTIESTPPHPLLGSFWLDSQNTASCHGSRRRDLTINRKQVMGGHAGYSSW